MEVRSNSNESAFGLSAGVERRSLSMFIHMESFFIHQLIMVYFRAGSCLRMESGKLAAQILASDLPNLAIFMQWE